ncbi:hypothetical protein BU24DRAFT_462558 [Aaosphaeria arxii CBS 175.79]|uniref:MARVEL domain-containing protein n=1 Tax=Aaosphaeria arxii CBS 175.79 TaxID=1450172 RepID=A0A6A5XSW6_9PLEO|nr:uncharacterized protein BU24DRAFT_462558 [Aaosphaeria arxii CBS 175.79]KAF2016398.1 hypothetical protein BU24DRAFT_462558 [Aaosphaeria arxii CBS 175.79]
MLLPTAYWNNAARIQRIVHIAQVVLVLAAFITGIALLADSTIQRSRSTVLVFVYSLKSIIVLLYFYLSSHTARFARFASAKAYFILTVLEALFWFTAFIIMCMGGGRCFGRACATIGVAATLSLLLSLSNVVLIPVTWADWRQSKKVPANSEV